MLASGHWYSSIQGGLAFLAYIIPPTVIVGLMLRWDSGARGAGWALAIAVPIFVAYLGAVGWLLWVDVR